MKLCAKEEPTKSLHHAAADGDIEHVKLRIRADADVSSGNGLAIRAEGQTPSSLAKERGCDEIVELLRKHGAKE